MGLRGRGWWRKSGLTARFAHSAKLTVSYTSNWELERHKESKRHLEKVALQRQHAPAKKKSASGNTPSPIITSEKIGLIRDAPSKRVHIFAVSCPKIFGSGRLPPNHISLSRNENNIIRLQSSQRHATNSAATLLPLQDPYSKLPPYCSGNKTGFPQQQQHASWQFSESRCQFLAAARTEAVRGSSSPDPIRKHRCTVAMSARWLEGLG